MLEQLDHNLQLHVMSFLPVQQVRRRLHQQPAHASSACVVAQAIPSMRSIAPCCAGVHGSVR